MRTNDQSEGPEDFSRKSITIPFLSYALRLFKALPVSSDLSCSVLLRPFLKARHI
jgi:hypothetical protein